MIVNMEATLDKVRSQTKRLDDETDSQYEARTFHLCSMLIEHEPNKAIMKPDQEESKETN